MSETVARLESLKETIGKEHKEFVDRAVRRVGQAITRALVAWCRDHPEDSVSFISNWYGDAVEIPDIKVNGQSIENLSGHKSLKPLEDLADWYEELGLKYGVAVGPIRITVKRRRVEVETPAGEGEGDAD